MSKYNLDLDYVTPLIDISREELNEIIAEADKIIQENKESPENLAVAYLKKAQCLQKQEDLDKRGVETEISDNSCDAYHINTQEQIKILIEKALELSPNMPEALMQMGKLYSDTIDIVDFFHLNDKSISMYTSAIELKPDYAAAFNNRGLEYSGFFFPGDEDRKKTISDLTEAIRIRPFDAMYYRNRGMKYLYHNEYEKGIADLSSAINYGSDEFKKWTCIYQDRGKAYMALKNYDKAIIDLSESIRLRPDKNEFLLTRRDAYLMIGKKEEAKADFDKYLRNAKRGNIIKCSSCGLPFVFLSFGGRNKAGDIEICERCIKKNEVMEKIKNNNETDYHEITKSYNDHIKKLEEDSARGWGHGNPFVAYWLTNLSIDELKSGPKNIKNLNLHNR